MCGIVGYIGTRKALPILLNGLKRLEYRGYDSSGIALHGNGRLFIEKQVGKISALENLLNGRSFDSSLGIAHTRWATHGAPSEINAHPHLDCSGKIAVVHNGIIENYAKLRQELIDRGCRFTSETDTETLPHLFAEAMAQGCSFFEAVLHSLRKVEGTYGIIVMHADYPDQLIAARKGSPLVIGHGNGEYFIASDAAPLVGYTTDVTFLEDGEVALVQRDGITIRTIDNQSVEPHVECIDTDVSTLEKGGYPHFMLKEIMEQPKTLQDSMRGRLLLEEGTAKLGGIQYEVQSLLNANR
ncbi:MAG: class II glutamine amidotransferase, partial [candidate division KSB1 bacterium]|nr:class II glutamine amidotransferase [candidate division KSB1 bacterium]